MPEEEHLPEGGKARVREGFFNYFLFGGVFVATSEGELWVLRAGMMRPNRGFILLLLNGTACLVRKEWERGESHTVVFTHLAPNYI